MTVLVLLAAAGLVTWLLRAAFIVLAPPGVRAARVTSALRPAAPAAFAAMAATALSGTARAAGGPVWPWLLASAIAGAVAWSTRNLAVTIGVAAVAISVLTAL